MKPQKSDSDWDSFLAFAETAAKVGAAISIWEVILFFSLKKTLKAMWSLLTAMQFLIYIGTW